MKYAIVLKHPEAGDVYWHAKALTWVEAHQFPTQFDCVHDAHQEWAANIWPELRHDLEDKVGYVEHPCWREMKSLCDALDELTEMELKQLVEKE